MSEDDFNGFSVKYVKTKIARGLCTIEEFMNAIEYWYFCREHPSKNFAESWFAANQS